MKKNYVWVVGAKNSDPPVAGVYATRELARKRVQWQKENHIKWFGSYDPHYALVIYKVYVQGSIR